MPACLSEQQFHIVQTCSLFQGVDPDCLWSVLSDVRCTLMYHQKGSMICGGTQFQRALGILLSGRIRVTRTCHDGKESPVSTQTPGAMFGMAVLFCNAEEFPTELHSESSCEVLYVREDLLLDLMRQNFTVAENYIRHLSGRILFLNRKIAGLSAGGSTHKLAQWILDHAEDNEAEFPAMSRLAKELNIGRASLYRAMEALEAAQSIRREGNRIHILEPSQLQRMHHDQSLD